MNSIDLENIKLIYFDIKNKYHITFLKKLLFEEDITKRFTGLFPDLNKESKLFDKGFFIEYNKELVGYVSFSNFNEEEKCVYIEGFAIIQKYRNKKVKDNITLAELATKKITNYLFNNYNYIEYIKATVAEDNIAAKKLLLKCGYYMEDKYHFNIINPNIKNKSI